MAMRWRIAILLACITTINYIDRSVFGVVAPVIRDLFSIGDADYGLITSGFLFAYGIGQLLSGPVIDRLGTKKAFSIAAILWSLSTIFHALGRGVWSFFALRVSLGITEAANYPGATKAVAQWFPARERSTAVGIVMLGSGLGAILTPPMTVWILSTLGWRWAFIIPGVLGLVWVWLWHRWYHLPEDHPGLKPEERQLILDQRSPQADRGSWTGLLKHREFWGILAARAVADFPFYFFLFWLPTYLIDARGFDLRGIALFAWLPFVAADIGAFSGGSLSSWLVARGHTINFARKAVIWLGAVLMLVTIPAVHTESSAVALALICFGMFAIQLRGSVFFTLPTDLFPAGRVATVWGVFGAVGSLGASVLGIVAGLMIERSGYENVFVMIAFLHIVSASILTLLVPRIQQVGKKGD
ncbi:MAG: MFS transporter [Xanthomonadales bacterium]|nr:MFS transporter [Xanthomonadales bacterium]